MSVMQSRLCKIYIHDLDVKSEAGFRQAVLHSGADNATSVRFVTDMNEADIWVLSHGSAFINVADSRKSKLGFSLWLNQEGRLIDADSKQKLEQEDVAKVVDAVVLGSRRVNKAAVTAKNSPQPSSMLSAVKAGADKKEGILYLAANDALFYCDFSSSSVKYNMAAKELVWGDSAVNVAIGNFEVIDGGFDIDDMRESCALFCFIWQLFHRLGKELVPPLTSNMALKLKTWPLFEQVEHDYEDCRLASFLQKRPLNIEQAVAFLKLNEDRVCCFFNAAYISGYAEIDGCLEKLKNIEKANQSGSALTGLWRKVRGAIGLPK